MKSTGSLLLLTASNAVVYSWAFAQPAATLIQQQQQQQPPPRPSSSALSAAASIESSAAQFSSDGFAAPDVDMNEYNLASLEEIGQEWTATLVPESTLREEGVYLAAKSADDLMVDTVRVSLPRRQNEGLGLELTEIAGGREDGLGIVVIEGIVPGGCADGSALMPGDSIVSLTTTTSSTGSSGGGMRVSEEVKSIATECFSYDRLVDVIVNELPPVENDGEDTLVLAVKRLRRKPKVTVTLQYPPSENEPDTTIELFSGENLRRAMLTRGIKLNDKLSERFDSGGMGDCGAEGTCGTCVVAIGKGDTLLNEQGIQESQILKKNPSWRFACKAIVGHGFRQGDMTIRVNPRQWNN